MQQPRTQATGPPCMFHNLHSMKVLEPCDNHQENLWKMALPRPRLRKVREAVDFTNNKGFDTTE